MTGNQIVLSTTDRPTQWACSAQAQDGATIDPFGAAHPVADTDRSFQGACP